MWFVDSGAGKKASGGGRAEDARFLGDDQDGERICWTMSKERQPRGKEEDH